MYHDTDRFPIPSYLLCLPPTLSTTVIVLGGGVRKLAFLINPSYLARPRDALGRPAPTPLRGRAPATLSEAGLMPQTEELTERVFGLGRGLIYSPNGKGDRGVDKRPERLRPH